MSIKLSCNTNYEKIKNSTCLSGKLSLCNKNNSTFWFILFESESDHGYGGFCLNHKTAQEYIEDVYGICEIFFAAEILNHISK